MARKRPPTAADVHKLISQLLPEERRKFRQEYCGDLIDLAAGLAECGAKFRHIASTLKDRLAKKHDGAVALGDLAVAYIERRNRKAGKATIEQDRQIVEMRARHSERVVAKHFNMRDSSIRRAVRRHKKRCGPGGPD
jgi:hypothetical protein